MKVLLIKSFKNHNSGDILDVSHRIHDHLLKLGCVAKPVPLIFAPDLLKAMEKAGTKKKPRKKTKEK